MSEENKTDLERTRELFEFLQGKIPDGAIIKKSERPRLTPDQAWTVIWYLGNQYWQVKDHVERCDVCGEIYDRHSAGEWLDYGGLPYSFCDNCISSAEFDKKMRRNPDKEARKLWIEEGNL